MALDQEPLGCDYVLSDYIGHFLLIMTDRLFFKMNKCTIITDDVETIENYGDKSIRFVAFGNGCWISCGKQDNTVESLDPLTTDADDDDLFNFLRFSEVFNPCLGDLIALFFSHNPFQMMIFSFDFN